MLKKESESWRIFNESYNWRMWKAIKIVYGKSFDTFDLFSEVAADLSKLIIEIEKNMGKKMTRYEILNGFKL